MSTQTKSHRPPSEKWLLIEQKLIGLMDIWDRMDTETKSFFGSKGYGSARNYVVVCLKKWTLGELKQISDHFIADLFMGALYSQKFRKIK